ncbi:MAG: hypothetical protein KDA46_11270 [Parvularculaceae bacterium]|nr:hypothetical protein [Parvularculaceae bacterium]
MQVLYLKLGVLCLGAVFATSGCSAESANKPDLATETTETETVAIETAATATTDGAATQNSTQTRAAAKDTAMAEPTGDSGVADLPYSRGKVFHSLDEYLAHLEQNSFIDLPYWREVKPDVYEWVVRMPGAKSEFATREELMERYGFTR